MKNYYKSTVLLAAVTVLIISVMLLDFFLFHDDPLIFWVSLPVIIAVSGLAIGKLLQIRKKEFIYFKQLDDTIVGANRVALVSFPLPIAIVDNNGTIIWCNTMFTECFFEPDEDSNNISIITDRPLDVFRNSENVIEFKNKQYVLTTRKPQFTPDEHIFSGKKVPEVLEDINNITMLYFNDITDLCDLREEYRLSEAVVMTILIDRFEDIQNISNDSEKTAKLYEIQKVLYSYFGTNAVLKKIADDRYTVVTQERRLNEMIADNMAVLDQIRDIEINEHSFASISIGIGKDRNKTIDEKEQDSIDALTTAVGRGGDQAAIKISSNNYKYIGAGTQNAQSIKRDKINFAAKALISMIKSCDAVYIMGHNYGDFDSVGSAIGLACAIRRMGYHANVVVDQEKNASKPLLKNFTTDYEPYLIMSPEEARAKFDKARSILIIVDTHTIKKLDDSELYERADKNRMVVIDHHRLSPGAIQGPAIMLQDPNASSAAELVTNIIQYFDVNPVLNQKEAEALLAGIVLDTKDFVMRASAATFEAAAFLKKLGADTVAVKKLFATPIDHKDKKAQIVSSARIYKKNFAVAVVKEPFRDSNLDIRIICSQAADDMLYISGVDAAFTLYPIGENAWSFSARSLGKINVQIIMESLGNKRDDGGGHQSMAGAQLYDLTLDEAEQKLYEAIDQFLDKQNQQ